MDRKRGAWFLIVGFIVVGWESAPSYAEDLAIRPAWEQHLEKVLDEPTTAEFIETPLEEAVRFLQERHQIPIQIDRRALLDDGIAAQEPIDLVLRDVPLRHVLRWILSPLGLTYVLENEVVLITTRDTAEARTITRVYRLAKIVGDKNAESQLAQLAVLLKTSVSPTRWHAGSDAVSLVPRSRSLVITQTAEIHREVEEVLQQLLVVHEAMAAGTADKLPLSLPARTQRAAILERKLDTSARFDFVETPLVDVVAFLREKFDLPVIFDTFSLDDEGIAGDVPVDFVAGDISLRSALDLMLSPLDLAWYESHGVLFIATHTSAEAHSITRVYPVHQLAPTPIDAARIRRITASGQANPLDPLTDALSHVFTRTVWDAHDSMAPYAAGQSLVVSTTTRGHEQFERLFAELRAQVPPVDPEKAVRSESNAVVVRIYQLGSAPPLHPAGGSRGGRASLEGSSTDDPMAPPSPLQEEGTFANPVRPAPPTPAELAAQLATAIPRLIEPNSWERTGSPGAISAVGSDLVVRQTVAVHEQIAELLTELGFLK